MVTLVKKDFLGKQKLNFKPFYGIICQTIGGWLNLSNIKNFKCGWQVKLFIEANSIELIGSGSEGSCYRGRDNKVYKFIEFDKPNDYNVEELITDDEIHLDSFAFPEELYVVGTQLKGYRSELVERDLFAVSNTVDIETIDCINFHNLSNAYKVMLIDVARLSNKNVLIYDLPFNLMFDGDKLTAIDTCGYKRVDYNPLRDNVRSLNTSMELLFKLWFESYKDENFKINGTDIDSFLGEVYSEIPNEIKERFNNNDNEVHRRR